MVGGAQNARSEGRVWQHTYVAECPLVHSPATMRCLLFVSLCAPLCYIYELYGADLLRDQAAGFREADSG